MFMESYIRKTWLAYYDPNRSLCRQCYVQEKHLFITKGVHTIHTNVNVMQ